jgi:hypothetical protein
MLDQEWKELAHMDIEPLNSSSSDIMRKVFLLKNSLGEIYSPNIFIYNDETITDPYFFKCIS